MTRNSRARQVHGRNPRARHVFNVDDFDLDHHNPFTEEPQSKRWMLTTFVAGSAGSMVVAAAVLGLFGEQSTSTQALASVQPTEMWQRPSVTLKGDFAAVVEQTTELQPFKPVSVAYRPQATTTTSIADSLLTSGAPDDQGDVTGKASLYPEIQASALSYDAGTSINRSTSVLDGSFHINAYDTTNLTTVSKTPAPEPVDHEFVLEQGDTLIDKLVEMGVSRDAAQAMTTAMEPVYPGTLLKAGQQFTLTMDNQQDFYGNFVQTPVQLSFSPGEKEEIVIESDENGEYVARVNGETSEKRSRYADENGPTQYRVSGKITSTLYAAAQDLGVPDNVIAEMIRAFSYDVDFQRQIGVGDTFEVFFGPPLSGSSKKRAVMHYARLNFGGNTKAYYRFTDHDGQTAYYDEAGKSASKFLIKTPVSGARMSSGFGLRRHPILGYTKMHTGVDFAAARGTPIRAAGNGVLESVGRKGGYGRAIVIDHGRGYETLYAHMSRFAAGMRAGIRVRQGQVIGYVGASGRATGPHLHYEVRINDKPVNPSKVRVAGSQSLESADMKRFKTYKQTVLAMMKLAPASAKVASAGN